MSTLEIKNPGYISTLTKTAGVPGTKTVDETDFIHTGLIKTLALQARWNFAVANGASSADMGFKITQSDVGGKTKLTVTSIATSKLLKLYQNPLGSIFSNCNNA